MVKVLIIEDDSSARLVTKLHLRNEYQVVEASDGMEAMELLKHQSVDLIIADVMMPKMNGDEAAKCIRKINPSIPIVAMSAQSEYSIDQTIMNDSISKPIDEQKLNHILSKYVA